MPDVVEEDVDEIVEEITYPRPEVIEVQSETGGTIIEEPIVEQIEVHENDVNETIETIVEATPLIVTINEGTAGPRGPQGIPGPPGPGGGSGLDIDDVSYTHVQGVADDIWTIIHPLSFNPNVTVVDSAGNEQVGSVRYSAQQTIVVSFSGAFSGTAYLS